MRSSAVQFPTPQDETELHLRVTRADPLAPVDTFTVLTEPLIGAVRLDLRCDEDVARDASVDALFEYLGNPVIYDPKRGRLCTLLTQIAKRNAIDRLRSRAAEAR